uniref:Stalipin-3 n=1 Tax=Desmodus rotundus TaxID=9430 RepID=M0QRW3_DESRO
MKILALAFILALMLAMIGARSFSSEEGALSSSSEERYFPIAYEPYPEPYPYPPPYVRK